MTRWLLIRRLRGPAYILLIGVMAMLQEWTNFGFGRSWPLLLILGGVFALAERAALAQTNLEAYDPVTGQPRPMGPAAGFPPASSAAAPEAPGVAPAPGSDSETGRL
jgi:hypothetical protein